MVCGFLLTPGPSHLGFRFGALEAHMSRAGPTYLWHINPGMLPLQTRPVVGGAPQQLPSPFPEASCLSDFGSLLPPHQPARGLLSLAIALSLSVQPMAISLKGGHSQRETSMF